MLKLNDHFLDRIHTHARATYPEECCGFLIGTTTTEKRVLRILSASNSNRQSRRNRYSIDPVEIVRADDAAQRARLDLVGIYHSHPDAPSQPSHIDRQYAWPMYTYLIISIENRIAKEVGAWQLSGEERTFQSEDMRIIE